MCVCACVSAFAHVHVNIRAVSLTASSTLTDQLSPFHLNTKLVVCAFSPSADGVRASRRCYLNVAIITVAVPFVGLAIRFEIIWRMQSYKMRAQWKKNEAKTD